jgi:hypothetical protein
MEIRPVRIEARYFDEALQGYRGVEGLQAGEAAVPEPDSASSSPRLDQMTRRMASEGDSR